MAKEKLNLDELKEKGLVHLAALLESKSEEDEPDFDEKNEKTETDKDEKKEDDSEKKEEVKESAFDTFIAGLELQEADIEKMKEAFASAVEARATELSESKLAGLETQIEKSLQEQAEANDKHVANYLDFVVEGWMKDNQVEIERQVKVDLAESFLTKLKGLFEEHSLVLESDEKVDQIAEANAITESVREELKEAVDALAESKKQVFAFQVDKVVAELTEGMTDTQRERFVALAHEIEVDLKEGIEAAREKLVGAKDIFTKDFSESEEKKEEVVLESEVQEKPEVKEEIVESEGKPQLDEKMASYVKAINRGFSPRHR